MNTLELPFGPGVTKASRPGHAYPAHRGCGGALLLREHAMPGDLGPEPLRCNKCYALLATPEDVPLSTVLRARDAAIVDRGVPSWPRVWCGGPAEPKGLARVTVLFQVTTKSEINQREHWRVGRARWQAQREATGAALTLPAGALPWLGPWCVRITRFATELLDDDNLQGAAKEIRDAVAAALHIDDGDPLIAWAYTQERGSEEAACRIEIWGAASCP